MVKPTFLCIGVQKSGTTSLIEYLSLHKDIHMNNKKEFHFFDCKDKYYKITENDINEYEKLFDTNKTVVGEKTPSYCYLQYAMDRIYNYNPNIKLILILREPISRAFSQYNMNLNTRGLCLNHVTEEKILSDFDNEPILQLSEIEVNGNNMVVRGFYDEIIEYILLKFPKNNLYIGISEEVKSNRLTEYNKIFKFLGCSELNEIQNIDKHVRVYTKIIPKLLEEKLYNIYKSHNEKLYNILGRKIDIWEEYYCKINSNS
jgi:hypothetical protein